MPDWVSNLQGIREILNAAGTALTRRKEAQFTSGLEATDDGSKTVVTVDGPTLATSLAGRHLVTNGSAVDWRRDENYTEMFDDFLHVATNGSDVLGDTPWTLSGTGTPAISQDSLGGGSLTARAGVIRLSTSGSTNDTCILNKALSSSIEIIDLDSVEIFSFQSLPVPANAQLVIGLGDSTSSTLGSYGYRFEITDTDVDVIRREASSDTDTVSVSATTFGRLGLLKSGSDMLVYKDGSQIGSFAEITGRGAQPIIRLETLNASSADVGVDFIRMTSTDFSRGPF